MTTTPTSPGTSTALSHADTANPNKDGFWSRLSTGTGAWNILRPRRAYYTIGAVLVIASIALIIFRGFNLGIDFAGGTKLTFGPPAGEQLVNSQIAQVVNDATGTAGATVQTVGPALQVTTLELSADQVKSASEALTSAFGLEPNAVADSAVSGTWGAEVSEQALVSVIVFLIAVALFIWIRYEYMASIAAVISTVQVMIITAGVYALVGFELTPATVIGLLTILGFSLYDTVVVFDKVKENARGLTSLTRRTYSESANLAVNETMMRSINTSLIALLPVGGLLVGGIALGAGTLKDLALVQLVGMLVGAYSSLFVAVPIAVDLRERQAVLKTHTKRVRAKRAAEGLLVNGVGDPIGRTTPVAPKPKAGKKSGTAVSDTTSLDKPVAAKPVTSKPVASKPFTDPNLVPGAAPRPGVRTKGKRPTGKASRPTGKRER